MHTDDNFAAFARMPTLGATAHRPKGLKVPCSAAELPALLRVYVSTDLHLPQDLGFLLAKNPDRVHERKLAFGNAHVF